MSTDLAASLEPLAMRNQSGPRGIRVMLVDDHPVVRVGLANVLSLNDGFVVVAQALAIGFELGILKFPVRSWVFHVPRPSVPVPSA